MENEAFKAITQDYINKGYYNKAYNYIIKEVGKEATKATEATLGMNIEKQKTALKILQSNIWKELKAGDSKRLIMKNVKIMRRLAAFDTNQLITIEKENGVTVYNAAGSSDLSAVLYALFDLDQ